MSKEKHTIVWENEIVGYIENLKADMFELYGDWVPESGAVTQKFLLALRKGEQLWVEIRFGEGRTKGTVEVEPSDEIEVNLRPTISNELKQERRDQ